ncbi:MAG: carboxypeptidase regulatory-like domain-containing protein [Planctomycetes bacterium]|nr:carboxypeptidase regulatory-like domain-containing protein [Planctomycetota bacterium]
MASRSKPLLVLVLVLVVVAAGSVGVWFAFRTPAKHEIVVAAPTAQSRAAAAESVASETKPRLELIGDAVGVAPVADDAYTTVAWPVKLALELVVDGSLPSVEGVPPLGSGRNARLAGTLVREAGIPVVGKVTFTRGLNAGRILYCNEEGAFGASDLYPGLSIVETEGTGIGGSTRELLLRANKDTPLNISYDAPASMRGRVFDAAENKPLADVEVELDGQRSTTDIEGAFHFPSMTAGDKLLLILRKDGYASYRELIGVARASNVPSDRFLFQMRRSGGLRVTFSNAPSTGAAELVLMKSVAFGSYGELAGQRNYPWHVVNPVPLPAGQTFEVRDLPEGDVDVRAYLLGCVATPPVTRVTIREGEVKDVVLKFEAAPTVSGRVLDEAGRPVENADVRLEAPDRTLALLNHFGQASAFLEAEVWPTFPMCVQRAKTGFDGGFSLSAWEKMAPTRYLIAESADGKLRAVKAVRATDTKVELVLRPDTGALGKLALEFPNRHQGLPIVCTVNGAPFAERVIPADQPLLVENLDEGIWRLVATWNGEALFPAPPQFQVRGDSKFAVALPVGAIDGQDAETLKRAGKL